MQALEYSRLTKIVASSVLSLLFVLVFLMLLSYSPFDPGWSHLSSTTQSISNIMGVPGAMLSDVLISFFGISAYAIPLLIVCEWSLIWRANSLVGWVFRVFSYFFILASTAVMCFMYVNLPSDTMTNAAGGIIGYELGQVLTSIAPHWAVLLVLLAHVLVQATISLGIHWGLLLRKVWLVPEVIKHSLGLSSHYPAYHTVHNYKVNYVEENHFNQPYTSVNDQTNGNNKPASSESTSSENELSALTSKLLGKNAYKLPPQRANAPDLVDAMLLPEAGQVQVALEYTAQNDGSLLPVATASNLPRENQLQELSALQRIALDNDALPDHTAWIEKTRQANTAASTLQPNIAAPSPLPLGLPTDPAASNVDTAIQPSRPVSVGVQRPSLISKIPRLFDVEPATMPPLPIVPGFDRDADLDFNHDVSPSLDTEEVAEASDEGFNVPLSHAMATAVRRGGLSPLPPISLLDKVAITSTPPYTQVELAQLSKLVEIKLNEFNIKAHVVHMQPGPVVTRAELELAPGLKASKITSISRDLARSLSMASVRVVEVIAGKPYVGLELPNPARQMVRLVELLDTAAYKDPKGMISVAMGKDISGVPVITDLAKAPHMLVAGTTGSGKSVAINAMLLSMLFKYTPAQLRLILIDPKQLELSNYTDIPHLLTPVVTDMKDAASSLSWCVNEMERRYKLLSYLKVRNVEAFNQKVNQAIANNELLYDPTWKASDSAIRTQAPKLEPLPMIVVVADEFADMIMQVGKKAEEFIQRLAQKSRAAGIHLILATQRPSVDVITGLIKANIPTRAALRVNSKIDSRTILDAGGAEDLLGHGDMLFLGPGKIEADRVHGAFISDDEVNRVCDAWRERGYPQYVDEILTPFDAEEFKESSGGPAANDRDPMFDLVVAFVLETRKVSASLIQRKFSIGFNRSARIVEQMEAAGIVSSMHASGKRDILV